MTNRTALNSEVVYSKAEAHENLCNVCNVTPQDAPKGVQAQKVLHPDKDVFILKIGKQTDEPNRTGNIEVIYRGKVDIYCLTKFIVFVSNRLQKGRVYNSIMCFLIFL